MKSFLSITLFFVLITACQPKFEGEEMELSLAKFEIQQNISESFSATTHYLSKTGSSTAGVNFVATQGNALETPVSGCLISYSANLNTTATSTTYINLYIDEVNDGVHQITIPPQMNRVFKKSIDKEINAGDTIIPSMQLGSILNSNVQFIYEIGPRDDCY